MRYKAGICAAVILLLIAAGLVFARQQVTDGALKQRKQGDPLANLPENIEVLTRFGERADMSPGNDEVAFMSKVFGDAMVMDLKSREISCLTCNIPGAAFLPGLNILKIRR
jgi:hypothetical protein